jgi:hypothetical protein
MEGEKPDTLDETIEETFPASDAPANTPETGIRIEDGVEDTEGRNRGHKGDVPVKPSCP